MWGGGGGEGLTGGSRAPTLMVHHRQKAVCPCLSVPLVFLLPFPPCQETGAEVVAVEDLNWKAETKGLPGQQMGLQLVLRVVADIGIVGFPNAGEGGEGREGGDGGG